MKRKKVALQISSFRWLKYFLWKYWKVGFIKNIETSLKAYSSVVIILMCVTFWIRVCFGKYPRAFTFDHMSSQHYLVRHGPLFWKHFHGSIFVATFQLRCKLWFCPAEMQPLQLTIFSVDDGWVFCWHLLLCVHSTFMKTVLQLFCK